MDVREAVDSSSWPDVDSQPLSLEDSWRLRVTAAHVFAIMKSRDVQNFGKVLGFLETTHKLLPRLVPAIKHMKILFGLKTMIIMWMLKEHKGMVETVTQILRFFPHKLPQYQDQCSPREMLVMRKNHVDFRNLAQALAVDKERLEDYMKTQMEKQYGERYAQKVEERLLHYLHLLEAELPRDTYIAEIMRKDGPMTAEDRLLLELITSKSDTIAATLRTLLHCARDQNRSADGGREHPQPCGEGGTRSRTQSSSPQFCSRHQRWVRSILRGCPDESSEEQQNQNQTKPSSSPLLFQSSSSSSSQDLTPSDLVPCPPQKPVSQTSPPAAAEPENHGAGPNSLGDTAPPSLLLPVIRLVDVAAMWSSCSGSKSSSERLVLLGGKRSCSPQDPGPFLQDPGPFLQDPGPFLQDPGPFLQDLGPFLQDPGPFLQDLGPFLQDPGPFLQDLGPFLQDPGPFLQDPGPFLQDPGPFLQDQGPFTPNSSSVSSSSGAAAHRNQLSSRAAELQSDRLQRLQTDRLQRLQSDRLQRLQTDRLQPVVTLTRLSTEECQRLTRRTATAAVRKDATKRGSCVEEQTRDTAESSDSSFDVNVLYSTGSSDGEDSRHSDSSYRPRVKAL
ncbi:TERF1-interacting nuclear factor 2 [Oryzias melastigma]|uniref:TERF1-interacting nuclear factor 2 n=1 Tax=Oryzias melastigma TaxID=30732 RepID=A0A834C1I8_ORYME|nr:TERF1-interacting nuclear factor 2 [Oryzias melastigma]